MFPTWYQINVHIDFVEEETIITGLSIIVDWLIVDVNIDILIEDIWLEIKSVI